MFRGIWKPRVDVPEFTRCCFCLPLRYGLLAWGYLKTICLSTVLFIFFKIISSMRSHEFDTPPLLIFSVIILIVDLVASIVFIAGGHLKHRLLYKISYYYSIGFLIAFILLFTANTIDDIIEIQKHSTRNDFYYVSSLMIANLFVCTPVIVIQVYVTLLTRSELMKLQTANTNLQFVNQTADDTAALNGFTA